MKIKYMGKLDPETNPLPTNKLKEGAIRFNEPTDRKKQNIQTSIVTFIIICIINFLFRDVYSMYLSNLFSYFILANILLVLSKLCQFYFYKEIYMFKIPRFGSAGVYKTEFTKKKYIAINLIPDILFGLVPYYISLTKCKFFLGMAAMFVVANSAVDFMNVYHAFVEMPPGSKTFLYQFNNYWYLPKKDNNN